MNFAELLSTLRKISDEHKVPLDKLGPAVDDAFKVLLADQNKNKATPEDLVKIHSGVAEFYNGNPNLEATSEEICAALGVPHNKGTSRAIYHARKNYLLTHQKAAE